MVTVKQLVLLGYRTQRHLAVLSVHFAAITVNLPASQRRGKKGKYCTRFEWKREKTINTNNCIVMGKKIDHSSSHLNCYREIIRVLTDQSSNLH
jgi:hypothetical protein